MSHHNSDHAGTVSPLLSTDSLSRNDVYNPKGEELGSVKDFMLDTRNGRINYAVLSYGGFLSLGEKLFAVPWDALKLDTVNKRFVLDVDKERLEKAPGFDKDHWPNMADETWAKDVHSYYGTSPYVTEMRS